MAKENFLKLGENKEGFAIVIKKAPLGFPDGVFKEMLWNLWDIGSKFGQEVSMGIIFKANPLILELYNYHRGSETDDHIGFVVRKEGEADALYKHAFMFDLENKIQVMWDKRIELQEITQMMQKVDAYALSVGLIQGGTRITINDSGADSSGKIMVEQVFARKNTIMLMMPGEQDETLKKFDHPELLVAFEEGGFGMLCLASEKDKVASGVGKKFQRLQDMGIGPKQVAKMSMGELTELQSLMASMDQKWSAE